MHTRSEVLAKVGGGWHRGRAEESCMDDRELAAQSEVPTTMPQRIADLLLRVRQTAVGLSVEPRTRQTMARQLGQRSHSRPGAHRSHSHGAAIGIVAFDNSARFASRHSTTSELPRTAHSGGSPETWGVHGAALQRSLRNTAAPGPLISDARRHVRAVAQDRVRLAAQAL
jgi:hypothetical protein